MLEKLSTMARIRLVLAMMTLVAGVWFGVTRAADGAGWIPHHQDTTVYVGHGEWAVGEERNCIALPQSDGAVIFLGCVERRSAELSPEVIPVTYWGKTHRLDMYEYVHADPGINTWNWHCRRYRNSLTCWAVN